MGIVNRTQDNSQKKEALQFEKNTSITAGETGVLCYIPFPCQLKAAQVAAFGVLSDVNLMLTVRRFIVGSGVTVYALGSTFLPNDFGTSGVITSGLSLPAQSSSDSYLMANDVIGYVVGGGSTALIDGMAGCFVVQPVQDIKVFLSGLA